MDSALYGTGESVPGSTAKTLRKGGLTDDMSAGNEALKEKFVQEHLEMSDANGCTSKATTTDDTAGTEDGELFGAPTDVLLDPRADDRPPHNRSGVNYTDEQEQTVPGARNIIRKNLVGKSPGGAWTLATPTPTVDPDGFEDPISDTFWKKVWVACAAHNVRHFVPIASAIY